MKFLCSKCGACCKRIGLIITNPIFELIDEDFSNLSIIGDLVNIQSIHPTFGDLDNDEDIDMVIGDNNGQIYYFENTVELGSQNEFPVFEEYELLNIDVGSFATPQLIDLNRDGLLDLVIGERMGIDNGVYNGINYYENIGSLENPEFENYTPEFPSGDYDENNNEIITKSLGGIHIADPVYLTSYTAPYVFEYDNTYYLAIGSESGLIYLYDNIETTISGISSLNLNTEYNLVTNNILEVNNCVHSKITILDLNNDDFPDLIRGNASGGVELFFGENFNINEKIYEKENIIIMPNPNNGRFSIQNTDSKHYMLTIYSSLGQIISSQDIINTITNIDLTQEKKGLYIIEIKNSDYKLVKRVIYN